MLNLTAGLGCLGLVELKLLFPFVSSSGFVLQLGPESTRGPPTTPAMGELGLGVASASSADGVLRTVRCWQGWGFGAECCAGPVLLFLSASSHLDPFPSHLEDGQNPELCGQSQHAVNRFYC